MKHLQLKKIVLIIFIIFSLTAIGGGAYLLGENPFIQLPLDEVSKEDEEETQETPPEELPSDAAAFDITIHCALWTSSTQYLLDGDMAGNVSCHMDCFWYNGSDGKQIDWGSGLSYTACGTTPVLGGAESDTWVGNIVYLRYSHGSFFNKRYMLIMPDRCYGFGTSVSSSTTLTSDKYYLYGTTYTTSESTAKSGSKTSLSGTYYVTFRKSYTITYMNQGRQYTTSTLTAGIGTSLISSKPTREGYTFKGWSDTNGGTTARNRFSANEANGSKTVYAIWEPNSYNITYMPNGGTPSSVYTQTVTYGQTFITKPADTYTRDGYTFLGWTLNTPGLTGAYINANTTYTYSTLDNTVLFAEWTINDYYIDVNGNLDGYYINPTGGAVDLDGYATFDMYINGSRVATQVTDYYARQPYGTTYEIRNIQLSYDKEYVGVYHDNDCTIAGSLSGTMPAHDQIVCLKIRTKTWNDYAASSYAGGSGTAADPYIIKTAEQLAKVAKDSRSNNSNGKFYQMAANIDLSSHVWEGIGNGNLTFRAAKFDGNMYEIKNIKTKVDKFKTYYGGLFSRADTTIENLMVNDSDIYGVSDAGTIVGFGCSDLKSIIVNNVTVSSVETSSGGLIGRAWNSDNGSSKSSIISCICKNAEITSNTGNVGGIVGMDTNQYTILQDCSVLNTKVTSGSGEVALIGGAINATQVSCYGQGSINGTEQKIMYGDSFAWGNWTYNALVNGGYPVQKTLFHIGGMSGSENVYNYLKNTLGFIET